MSAFNKSLLSANASRQPGPEREGELGGRQHGGARHRFDAARGRLRAVDELKQDHQAADPHDRAHARARARPPRRRDRRPRPARRSRRDGQTRCRCSRPTRSSACGWRRKRPSIAPRSKPSAAASKIEKAQRRLDPGSGDGTARRRPAPTRRRRSDLAARSAVPERVRQDPRRLQRRLEQADGDGARGGRQHQRDPRRFARNLQVLRRSFASHRTAGGAARRGGGGARRDHRDAEELGRRRNAGGRGRRQRRRRRQEGRGGRQAGGAGDGRDRQVVRRRSARSSA